MQTVQFTPEETDVLTEALQHMINEMEIEVFRTDSHDFKEKLKHRRDVLESLFAKIAPIPANV